MDIAAFEKKYRAKRRVFVAEKRSLQSGSVTKSTLAGIQHALANTLEEIVTYAAVTRNLCKDKEPLSKKIVLLYDAGAINEEWRDRLHDLRRTRNAIAHPGEDLTRENCGLFLQSVAETREILAPYDPDIAKRHRSQTNAGTIEHARENSEKLLRWLRSGSATSEIKRVRASILKYADFWRFALGQCFFYSHDLGDYYGEAIGLKTRGNLIGRWSRDGWIYTDNELSKIVPKSRKYYFNPDIVDALKEFLGM